MEELQHFSHECSLTLPKIVNGICSICLKDDHVDFTCNFCSFHICKACTQLPQKVSHDFHPEHALEFCLRQYDRKPAHIVCSGCGIMSSGSFYQCRECEIYLDLACATQENIFRAWDFKELLHDSHIHLLKRCRPGPDARGSCLLCELPLFPYALCYGCVHCYLFFHERCIDIPREIQHPAHPAHSLKRFDYTQSRACDACGYNITSVPFGCVECGFDLHLRCADSLLRGLIHKSHHHRLFYRTRARKYLTKDIQCQICMESGVIFLDSYYLCVECHLVFHFECLGIPDSVFKKSCHTHALTCQIFLAKDDYAEYCGVCETMIHVGHHAYSCEECDFVGHIECILQEESPSPLYLKDLYSCGADATRATNRENLETNNSDNKLMVIGYEHIHVMSPALPMSEISGYDPKCFICRSPIYGSPCSKCETCNLQTHSYCAELGRPFRHRVHPKHALTLFPQPYAPEGITVYCDICSCNIRGYNLLCRICNFIIHTDCIFKSKHFYGEIQSGQKLFANWKGYCTRRWHARVFQVIVSKSNLILCVVCGERAWGKVVSCFNCEDVYHPECAFDDRVVDHPLHSNHLLSALLISGGSKCVACKEEIVKYGYNCSTCQVNFHVKCIKAVKKPEDIGLKFHTHHDLYNFWVEDSRLTRSCRICKRPCGASFYGCIDCSFSAHVECVGFPASVKNQVHQHTVVENNCNALECCSLCGSEIDDDDSHYSCNHCKDLFHLKCIMSMNDREAVSEEEQIKDIYLMNIERDLFRLLPPEEVTSSDSDTS
ncbi:unnamed protein product [Microthlaspi erraticum]|uniref:Phorbol-ester/DAG-type domain-containing protein n=1 Tax=Microthlaspi erraticum TaxID=1685480 RepID=A0A6D2K5P0_9BRAS|nr:unnamed protein product [Microthlaspi erraticum]